MAAITSDLLGTHAFGGGDWEDADDRATFPVENPGGFTGSTEVGRLLMRQCADHVKKVSLELGGNVPFIVFDDADLEIAAAAAIVCTFRNSGQTCSSANRIPVQECVYDALVHDDGVYDAIVMDEKPYFH